MCIPPPLASDSSVILPFLHRHACLPPAALDPARHIEVRSVGISATAVKKSRRIADHTTLAALFKLHGAGLTTVMTRSQVETVLPVGDFVQPPSPRRAIAYTTAKLKSGRFSNACTWLRFASKCRTTSRCSLACRWENP